MLVLGGTFPNRNRGPRRMFDLSGEFALFSNELLDERVDLIGQLTVGRNEQFWISKHPIGETSQVRGVLRFSDGTDAELFGSLAEQGLKLRGNLRQGLKFVLFDQLQCDLMRFRRQGRRASTAL